jgi:hypothetical protein
MAQLLQEIFDRIEMLEDGSHIDHVIASNNFHEPNDNHETTGLPMEGSSARAAAQSKSSDEPADHAEVAV